MVLGVVFVAALAIWAVRIYRKPEDPPPSSEYDDYLDQTCELNHNPDQ